MALWIEVLTAYTPNLGSIISGVDNILIVGKPILRSN